MGPDQSGRMPYLLPEGDWDRSLLRRFGVALRRCRLRAGLSQTVLAERSGVSQSMISRLENGKAPAAPVRSLVRLGDVLGLDLPLAACPHRHQCAWRPLLEDGREDHRHEPPIAEDYLSTLVPELAPDRYDPGRGEDPPGQRSIDLAAEGAAEAAEDGAGIPDHSAPR